MPDTHTHLGGLLRVEEVITTGRTHPYGDSSFACDCHESDGAFTSTGTRLPISVLRGCKLVFKPDQTVLSADFGESLCFYNDLTPVPVSPQVVSLSLQGAEWQAFVSAINHTAAGHRSRATTTGRAARSRPPVEYRVRGASLVMTLQDEQRTTALRVMSHVRVSILDAASSTIRVRGHDIEPYAGFSLRPEATSINTVNRYACIALGPDGTPLSLAHLSLEILGTPPVEPSRVGTFRWKATYFMDHDQSRG